MTATIATTTVLTGFGTREDAAYWGGGVLAAGGGGFWSLHHQSTPTGGRQYHVGLDAAGRPTVGAGWPADVSERYVVALPDGGGERTICVRAKP